mmetsp:Transcript_113146/g.259340  ORF Transcript_113146/g.259340 Transcript_113146/m.259340 type:complete len:270 (-) Transcript_113146:343-1152(-)
MAHYGPCHRLVTSGTQTPWPAWAPKAPPSRTPPGKAFDSQTRRSLSAPALGPQTPCRGVSGLECHQLLVDCRCLHRSRWTRGVRRTHLDLAILCHGQTGTEQQGEDEQTVPMTPSWQTTGFPGPPWPQPPLQRLLLPPRRCAGVAQTTAAQRPDHPRPRRLHPWPGTPGRRQTDEPRSAGGQTQPRPRPCRRPGLGLGGPAAPPVRKRFRAEGLWMGGYGRPGQGRPHTARRCHSALAVPGSQRLRQPPGMTAPQSQASSAPAVDCTPA